MRTMYTTTPDAHCYEVEPGIYGRPVHTSFEDRLKAKGWVYEISQLKGDSDVRQKEEVGQKEEVEVTDELIHAYEVKFGKKPHHKMKVETILEKLEESDD